jgi:hypothetical protein
MLGHCAPARLLAARFSSVAARTAAEIPAAPRSRGSRTSKPVREPARAVPAEPDVIFRAATQMKT